MYPRSGLFSSLPPPLRLLNRAHPPHSLLADVPPPLHTTHDTHKPTTNCTQQRGRSGRNFAAEAAEASRTFQPRTPGAVVAVTRDHDGFSPAPRDGGTVIGGGGGGVWGKGYCGVCGAENSMNNTVPPSPSSRYASPRAGDNSSNNNNNDDSPSRAATRAAYNAWVNRCSQGSPLGKVGEAGQESAGRNQRDGGGGPSAGCGCDAGGRMRVRECVAPFSRHLPLPPYKMATYKRLCAPVSRDFECTTWFV